MISLIKIAIFAETEELYNFLISQNFTNQ